MSWEGNKGNNKNYRLTNFEDSLAKMLELQLAPLSKGKVVKLALHIGLIRMAENYIRTLNGLDTTEAKEEVAKANLTLDTKQKAR